MAAGGPTDPSEDPPASLLRRMLCIRVHTSRPAAESVRTSPFRHRTRRATEVGRHHPGRTARLHLVGSLPGQPAAANCQPLSTHDSRRTARWEIALERTRLLRAVWAEDAD